MSVCKGVPGSFFVLRWKELIENRNLLLKGGSQGGCRERKSAVERTCRNYAVWRVHAHSLWSMTRPVIGVAAKVALAAMLFGYDFLAATVLRLVFL